MSLLHLNYDILNHIYTFLEINDIFQLHNISDHFGIAAEYQYERRLTKLRIHTDDTYGIKELERIAHIVQDLTLELTYLINKHQFDSDFNYSMQKRFLSIFENIKIYRLLNIESCFANNEIFIPSNVEHLELSSHWHTNEDDTERDELLIDIFVQNSGTLKTLALDDLNINGYCLADLPDSVTSLACLYLHNFDLKKLSDTLKIKKNIKRLELFDVYLPMDTFFDNSCLAKLTSVSISSIYFMSFTHSIGCGFACIEELFIEIHQSDEINNIYLIIYELLKCTQLKKLSFFIFKNNSIKRRKYLVNAMQKIFIGFGRRTAPILTIYTDADPRLFMFTWIFYFIKELHWKNVDVQFEYFFNIIEHAKFLKRLSMNNIRMFSKRHSLDHVKKEITKAIFEKNRFCAFNRTATLHLSRSNHIVGIFVDASEEMTENSINYSYVSNTSECPLNFGHSICDMPNDSLYYQWRIKDKASQMTYHFHPVYEY